MKVLLHQALGRPRQAEAQAARSLPRRDEHVRSLSWEQLRLVFASQVAEEIAAVMNGGDGLPRERLACLGPAERRLLREALAEPQFV